MSSRWTRVAMIAVLTGLLLLSLAATLRSIAVERLDRVAAEEAWRLSDRISRSAREIDLAGSDALAQDFGDDAPDAAGAVLEEALERAGAPATLKLVASASFKRREDGLRLRRVAAAADIASPGDAVALREDAERAGRVALDGLGGGVDALRTGRLAPSERVSAAPLSFWVIWPAADGSHALGGLFELQAAATVADGALRLNASLLGGALGIEDAEVAAAPIADGRIVVGYDRAPGFMPLIDLEDVGPSLAPSIALAGLIGAAFLGLIRRASRRDAAFAEEQKRTLESIAAKQRALDESEERFRHLAESANVIPWTADLDRQRFTYIGPQIESLSGYPAATWYAAGFWAHHIHPGDRHKVITSVAARTPDGRYDKIDYRIRAANGRMIHVRNMMSVTIETHETQNGPRRATVAQGFLLDVTELANAAATIELARERAEEANRVKSEFLANMSHELRTPLNAVIGFSEIMKEEFFGPLEPRYREYAESVHASGKHLLELINDILDLSKIEAGRIELSEEETEIEPMLAECRALMQERVASAGLHFKFDVADDGLTMVVDERRIRQVVINLLSNAVKFTKPGGSITLGARRIAGQGAAIWVADTGIGMASDEIPRALSKFGQIDGELARKHDGTGLGLPIAKSFVEMHGGRIAIQSEKGVGTRIEILLPEERIVLVEPGASGGAHDAPIAALA